MATMKTYPSRNLSVSIKRSPQEVYDFIHDTRNLPIWAKGLDPGLKVMMTERNKYGVLDHTITLPNGAKIFVPLKVCANHEGSEVIFTLYQLPGMTEEKFRLDLVVVQKDLEVLKEILETKNQ